MTETETITPVVKPRLCQIDLVLGRTIGELLKAQPTNPVVRAQAMALIGQEIPPELVEYEPIQEWIETTIRPKSAPVMRAPPSGTAFEINVEFSEMEMGTCDYSCNRSGNGVLPITAQDIRQSIEGCANFDEFIDSLDSRIRENARDYCDMDSSDYDYSNHEGVDYENADTNYNRRDLERLALNWLENNMPDTLEEWGE